MGRRRQKSGREILAQLEAPDDGHYERRVGFWTFLKLAILHQYLPGFSNACQIAGGGVYVDGMAGPGIGKVKAAQQPPFRVWGSPMIALRTLPQLRKVILMDLDPLNVEALDVRCKQFDGRALVRGGDVNRDLLPVLRKEVEPWAPCFCFLDPQGPELKWSTVRGIASLPRTKRKPELMILFPLDMAVLRLMPVKKKIRDEDRQTLSEMFATDDWWNFYQARVSGTIDGAEARAAYLDLYQRDLEDLGYKQVIYKPVVADRGPGGWRKVLYHLFFATDHDVGDDIMRYVFDRSYALDPERPPLFEL